MTNNSKFNIGSGTMMMAPGGRLNIKMWSYQYRDPHNKDKMVDRLIFNMGIPIPGKDSLYIETGPRSLLDPMLAIIWTNVN